MIFIKILLGAYILRINKLYLVVTFLALVFLAPQRNMAADSTPAGAGGPGGGAGIGAGAGAEAGDGAASGGDGAGVETSTASTELDIMLAKTQELLDKKNQERTEILGTLNEKTMISLNTIRMKVEQIKNLVTQITSDFSDHRKIIRKEVTTQIHTKVDGTCYSRCGCKGCDCNSCQQILKHATSDDAHKSVTEYTDLQRQARMTGILDSVFLTQYPLADAIRHVEAAISKTSTPPQIKSELETLLPKIRVAQAAHEERKRLHTIPLRNLYGIDSSHHNDTFFIPNLRELDKLVTEIM